MGPSELVLSKTMQEKYLQWGIVRKSKIETEGFDSCQFCSTPVMKLGVTNSCLGKNNMVQCNCVMGACGLICRALNILNLYQVFTESHEYLERTLTMTQSQPLPPEGTTSTRQEWSEFHPIWCWILPRMWHPQHLWAPIEMSHRSSLIFIYFCLKSPIIIQVSKQVGENQ